VLQQEKLETIVTKVVLAKISDPLAIIKNLLERKQYELAINII